MLVTCPCGTTFEARSSKARYCSDRCRKRQGKSEALAQNVVTLMARADEDATAVVETTRAALAAADKLQTPLGQAALALAARLDAPGLDTGSAMAAVARQLEALLGTVLKGAAASTAPERLRDELAERRRRHGA